MSLVFNRDGSATFISDNGDGVTQVVAKGTPTATVDAMYLTFQAAHPVIVSPPPAQLVVIPSSNPGVTGALYLNNTTLQVSLGPNAAAQIGATGPPAVIIPTLG